MPSALLAGAFNTGVQIAQNQLNKNWQEKMYNQYQSPSAMVRQYQSAGLNPALMYGQNLQSSFNQPAAQNQLDPVGSALVAAQIKQMNAQTANIQADTESKQISNTFSPALFKQQLEQGRVNIQNTLAGIDKIRKDIEVSDASIYRMQIENSLTSAQIDQVLAQADKTLIEAANEALRSAGIDANNRLIAAQVVTEELKPAYMALEMALSQANISKVGAETGLIAANTASVQLDSLKKTWEKEFRDSTGVEPSEPLWNTMTTLLGRISNQVATPFNVIDSEVSNIGNKIKGLISR